MAALLQLNNPNKRQEYSKIEMPAARRMLQIRDVMLSIVRMKFAFEMFAFRAIITWTLWLLLLLHYYW